MVTPPLHGVISNIEWLLTGFNGGRANSTLSGIATNVAYVYGTPGTYTARVEAMDKLSGARLERDDRDGLRSDPLHDNSNQIRKWLVFVPRQGACKEPARSLIEAIVSILFTIHGGKMDSRDEEKSARYS